MNPAAMPVAMAYLASKRISPAPDLRDAPTAGFPRVVNEGEKSPPVMQESPLSRRIRGRRFTPLV
jgi:hypothetical protein